MAFSTFASGVNTSFSSQLNSNFLPTKIAELYTGTGFDCSETTADETTTNNTTLSLSSSELDNATYLLISISYSALLSAPGGGNCTLKVERAQSGGAFTTVLAETNVCYAPAAADGGAALATIILPITLTSGEKSAGIDIKITGKSQLVSDNGTATVTNLGTILQTSY